MAGAAGARAYTYCATLGLGKFKKIKFKLLQRICFRSNNFFLLFFVRPKLLPPIVVFCGAVIVIATASYAATAIVTAAAYITRDEFASQIFVKYSILVVVFNQAMTRTAC